jgi:hypothetical protein
MAMDRAKRLAILNAASDESLATALSALGIEDSDDMDPYGENQENLVPTWNSLDVSVPATSRGPIASKEALFMPAQGPRKLNQYGLPEPGDQEEFMSATGMV